MTFGKLIKEIKAAKRNGWVKKVNVIKKGKGYDVLIEVRYKK